MVSMLWLPPVRRTVISAVPAALSARTSVTAKPSRLSSGASLSTTCRVRVLAVSYREAPRWSTMVKVPNFSASASLSSGTVTRISLTHSPSAKVRSNT